MSKDLKEFKDDEIALEIKTKEGEEKTLKAKMGEYLKELVKDGMVVGIAVAGMYFIKKDEKNKQEDNQS